jgi:hypothetical protein
LDQGELRFEPIFNDSPRHSLSLFPGSQSRRDCLAPEYLMHLGDPRRQPEGQQTKLGRNSEADRARFALDISDKIALAFASAKSL